MEFVKEATPGRNPLAPLEACSASEEILGTKAHLVERSPCADVPQDSRALRCPARQQVGAVCRPREVRDGHIHLLGSFKVLHKRRLHGGEQGRAHERLGEQIRGEETGLPPPGGLYNIYPCGFCPTMAHQHPPHLTCASTSSSCALSSDTRVPCRREQCTRSVERPVSVPRRGFV